MMPRDDRFGDCGYDLRNLDVMRMSWRAVGESKWHYWLYFAVRGDR